MNQNKSKESEYNTTGNDSISGNAGTWRRILCVILMLVIAACGAGPAGVPRSSAAGAALIAFTYDDGPSFVTEDLLNGLKQRNVSATFFMIGHSESGKNGLEYYPELADRMVREGHQLANHSYYHINMDQATPEQVQIQIDHTEKLLYKHMGGEYIDMFRPPNGQINDRQKRPLDVPVIQWSYDSGDSYNNNANTIYRNIVNGAADGGIIHIHDLSPASVEGSLRAVDALKNKGFEFVTVSELLRRRGITPENGKSYSSAKNAGVNLPAYTAPTISCVRNYTAETSQVYFSADDAGLTLYYTTDGSYPTMASQKYEGPFEIRKNLTFTVVGYDKWGTRTPVMKQTVISRQTAVPKASNENGMIRLSCDTDAAVMYYTMDGSTPTVEDSTRYTGPFRMAGTSHTLKIIAARPDLHSSEIAVYAVTDSGAVFSDLDVSRWYFPYVNTAVTRGFMSGMGDQIFAPQDRLNRAMMTEILFNLAGRPNTAAGYCSFLDVKETDWFFNSVRWAASQGIVMGYSETVFLPREDITREQMVTMLDRYAEKTGYGSMDKMADISGFPDAGDVHDYAEASVRRAVAAGLLKGYEDGTLKPRNPVTRAETAAVLVRYTEMGRQHSERTIRND